MSEAELRARLARIRRDPGSASLLDAALIVAEVGRQSPDPAQITAALDALADAGRPWVEPHVHPRRRIEGLCSFLNEDRGFGGDADRYYERDNSMIDRVLATGRGIPITLAIVYVEVARRLGLQCEGVNFPGHFLVRCRDDSGPAALDTAPLLVDPFAGRLLGASDCKDLLQRSLGPDADLGDDQLQTADALMVLVRMLNNLKQLAAAERRWLDALRYSELILIAAPALVAEHGERAALYERLGDFDLALAELQLLDAAVEDDSIRARLAEEMLRLSGLGSGGRTLH